MNPSERKDVQIFNAALEISPPAERAAYLDRACAADEPLRRKVEALLLACGDADEFFKAAPGATMKIGNTALLATITEQAGDRIGNYKLREKIGEGGCGVVYVAEQEKPVRRRVALKVIKLGMDTRSVIARFEAERQALAMMDHPNIAKVLDAGATDAGRPYFVMELVRGIRITDYCDQNNLSTKDRLDLFMKVCHAIQHAHQKGIIHRDIKPSNILVTLHDGVPVPKVIDFGIAKATEGKLTELTVYTELHQFIGTPAYMSPEQAEMSALDIDTRSDIYALGVLLYELLTGQTPFDGKQLVQSGLDEIRRTIREVEPPRPSTRLSTMVDADLTTVAKRHSAEPSKFSRLVRGDLDWIVMTCLEKDRTRRYETANGLATDIQRHLNNEPIRACPPSTVYRLQKLMRRNKLAFAAGTAIAISLVSGLGLALWMFSKEARARTAAEASTEAERKAKESEASHRRQAQEISDFLVSALRSPDPSRNGRTVTVAEVLDRNARELQERFADDPRTKARLYQTIGLAYVGLGLVEESLPLFERSVDLFTSCAGKDAVETLWAKQDLALHYWEAGKPSKALPVAEDLLRARLAQFGAEHQDTILVRMAVGNYLFDLGRRDEGLAEFEAGYKQLRARWGPEHVELFWPTSGLADKYRKVGRTQEALALEAPLLQRRIKALGEDHPDTLHSMRSVASCYAALRRLEDAAKLLRKTVALSKNRLGREHVQTEAAMRMLAAVLSDQGDLSNAEALFRETLALSEARPDNASRGQSLRTRQQLFALLTRQERWADAELVAREAVRLAREQSSASPAMLEDALADWANALFRTKRFADAEHTYRERLSTLRQRHSSTNDKVLKTSASLGRCLSEWALAEHTTSASLDRAREGERFLRECLTICEGLTNLSRGDLGDTRSRLAGALFTVAMSDPTLVTQERLAGIQQAETMMLGGQELMAKSTSIDASHHRDGFLRLIQLYEAWGKPDKIAEWKQKLATFDESKKNKPVQP